MAKAVLVAVFDKFKESLMIGSAYGGFRGRGWVTVAASGLTREHHDYLIRHPPSLEEVQRRMGTVQGGVITKAHVSARRITIGVYAGMYQADLTITVSDQ